MQACSLWLPRFISPFQKRKKTTAEIKKIKKGQTLFLRKFAIKTKGEEKKFSSPLSGFRRIGFLLKRKLFGNKNIGKMLKDKQVD